MALLKSLSNQIHITWQLIETRDSQEYALCLNYANN